MIIKHVKIQRKCVYCLIHVSSCSAPISSEIENANDDKKLSKLIGICNMKLILTKKAYK